MAMSWTPHSVMIVFTLILLVSRQAAAQRVVVVTEKSQNKLFSIMQDTMNSLMPSVTVINLELDRTTNDLTLSTLCAQNNLDLMVDLSFGGWIAGRKLALASNWNYVRVEVANHQVMSAVESFIRDRNDSDLALITENKEQLQQSLFFMVTNSYLRVLAAHLEEQRPLERLASMRPRATNYVIMGDNENVRKTFNHAQSLDLLTRDRTWTLIFNNEFDQDSKKRDWLNSAAEGNAFYVMEMSNCCDIIDQNGGSCTCPQSFSMTESSAEVAATLLAEMLEQYDGPSFNCNSSLSEESRNTFNSELESRLASSTYALTRDKYDANVINAPLIVKAAMRRMDGNTIDLGEWNLEEEWELNMAARQETKKRFLRVGVLLKKPWAWVNNTMTTGTELSDLDKSLPDLGLVGYSLEVLHEMVKEMDFDYELVAHVEAGQRDSEDNRTWTGLMGDIISMDVDLSVAPLTMTTEREEMVDFVSPFFAQSGISILLRKKLPKSSIFKFLQVLDIEVWLGIVAAVVAVAIMLWFVDRLSPYSSRNNPQRYADGTRHFNMGESLWFSLTSLTPQGGGECPKSLSARILVASYWLFIVLMLATFTANLAAFLTVERMQMTVQSLDELGAQTRINYSVLDRGPALEYFNNMKFAEEELFKQWKAVALASAADDTRYRVWDYPVREQYTHMLKVMQSVGLMRSVEEALALVQDSLEGEFAFIHEKTELEFYFYDNCNFTLVGDAFAEQPLAFAVQQGSMLLAEISDVVLRLQKESFFDSLSGQFWSSAKRSNCPVLDDSEGITLYSLGGIFIATVAGLSLSMMTLGYEVYRQKGVDNNRVNMVPEIMGHHKGHLVNNKIMTVGSKQVPIPGALVE